LITEVGKKRGVGYVGYGYIIKLNRVLGRAINDSNLKATVSRMEEKVQIFDQLRDTMRIAVANGKKGLNDDGENVDMKTIKKAVTIFRNSDKIKAAVIFFHIPPLVSVCDRGPAWLLGILQSILMGL